MRIIILWRYSAVEYGWIDESMSALRRDFLPDDLVGVMASAGVDGAVTVQARQTLEETRWLLGWRMNVLRFAVLSGGLRLRARSFLA